jgi:siroheme synthase
MAIASEESQKVKSRSIYFDSMSDMKRGFVMYETTSYVIYSEGTLLHEALQQTTVVDEPSEQGKVYLISAGDPDLMTIKALRCLQTADVVLYDCYVNPQLLNEVRQGATRVVVGKGSHYPAEQSMMSELLIAYARQNCNVVCLKSDDPYIFVCGGEEAEALIEARVPFEIVPGSSSVIVVPGYAGIPVTHCDYSSRLTIVTEHEELKETSQQIS